MNDEFSQFNMLSNSDSRQTSSLSPYSMPSGQEMADASVVNSSGFSMSPGSILSFGGDMLGAFGALTAGNEQDAAYQFNAQLALEQGEFSVKDLDKAESDTLSTQRAMYAKSGVTLSGSPVDTAYNTAAAYEMDKQITTYNAKSKANMDTFMGKAAKSQAQMKAGEELIQGAASLAMAFA